MDRPVRYRWMMTRKLSRFMQAIKDFKSGKRANPMMTKFASQLSHQDAANLAAYYASLKKK